MKKLFVIICLIFTFPFYACGGVKNNAELDYGKTESDVVTDLGGDNSFGNTNDNEMQDNVQPNIPQIPEIEDDEQEKKKKTYIVSTVNSLRVRSGASTNSAVVGNLDKNDALLLVEKVGNYYKTTFKEKTAFVHANYCDLIEVETGAETAEKAIDIASGLMGYPYVWGSQRYHWGNGVLNKNFVDGEFDCSALVQYAYYKADKIILDVTSRKQSHNGVEVAKSDLKRGDLMFFTNASRKNKTGEERIGHVGIYFGNNYILHTASDHAVIEPISALRWSYYLTARRVA